MLVKYLLVGSKATYEHGILVRSTQDDYDLICSSSDFRSLVEKIKEHHQIVWIRPTDSGQAVKFHRSDHFGGPFVVEAEFSDGDNHSPRLIMESQQNPLTTTLWGVEVAVASVNTLYMMKMAHRFKKDSPHFLKTMDHIHEFRRFGAVIDNPGLYEMRQDETYVYHHPRLDQTKSEFFTPTGELKYVFDHDSIHRAVATFDVPMYTLYAKDGEEVASSREKFEAMPEGQRLFGVAEEAYVLALERSVLPFGTDSEEAFLMALEKVCTSITSGWFREFAWENYHAVVEVHDRNYVRKFNDAYEKGLVLPYDS